MKRMNPGQADGFSLIEVGVALAVATFCLVPIVGLLPVGLTNNQSIVRETMATSLADAVIDDLRATPSTATTSPNYGLSIPATGAAVTTTLFLTEDAVKLTTPSTTRPTYLATVVLTPAASATPLNAASVRILITWPALPNQANDTVPTQYQGAFETVVGLMRN